MAITDWFYVVTLQEKAETEQCIPNSYMKKALFLGVRQQHRSGAWQNQSKV